MTRHLSHNESINSAGTFTDVGQLKALSTITLPDSTWAYVEGIGEYFFNTNSIAVESIPDILNPNSGLGRWHKKSVATVSDYNLIKQTSSVVNKLNLSGGTLTGPLTLNADPVIALQAATKQYVDRAIENSSLKPSVQNISGNVTLDLSSARVFYLTLTGNVTSFGFSNETLHTQYMLYFIKGASNYSFTWASGKYRFPFASAPILTNPTTNGTSPARSTDIITAFCSMTGRLDIVRTPDLIEN